MHSRLMIIFIGIICLAGLVFAQGGTDSHSSGVCWWIEHTDLNIRAEVMDSSEGISQRSAGSFAIGGVGPEYTNLTHNFHWPDSILGQDFVLFIDGSYYTISGSYSSMLCGGTVPVILIDSTDFIGTDTSRAFDGQLKVTSHWRQPIGFGYVDIWQELKPETLIVPHAMYTETLATIRIKYNIVNNDPGSANHTIGIKLRMDVEIDGNDHPDAAVGGSYAATCMLFEAPVPSYWQAYDDYYNPFAAVGRGVLRGRDCVSPDIFAIGQGPAALNLKLWVDPHCPGDAAFWSMWEGFLTSDVAAVIQWNPEAISFGSEKNYITYYGFGSSSPPDTVDIIVDAEITPPTVLDCVLDTLSDLTITIHQEDAGGLPFFNDTICVSLPPWLTLDSVYWDTTTVGGGWTPGDTCIYFDSLPAFQVVPTVWYLKNSPSATCLSEYIQYYANSPDAIEPTIDSVAYNTPCFSGIAPDIWFIADSMPGTFVNCCSFYIPIEYDDDEGITDLPSPTINGETSPEFIIPPLPTDPIHDIFHVQPPCSLLFADRICSIMVVSPEDIYGCCADETLRTIVILDTLPPEIYGMNPCDTILSETSPAISFFVRDDTSGVNLDSILFSITIGDGTPSYFRTSSAGVSELVADPESLEAWISYLPSSPFPPETTITVCVHKAADRVEVCSPNVMTDSICCTFEIDAAAPTVEFLKPAADACISCDPAEICFVVHDANGILTTPPETLIVSVNGYPYTADDMTITGDTICLEDTYNSPYISGTAVNVIIEHLSDTVGNYIDPPITHAFTVDTKGPYVELIDPPSGGFIPDIGGASICSMYVDDSTCGVIDSLVVVSVYKNSIFQRILTDVEFRFNGNWLVLEPTLSDLEYLDTVCFCLDTLYDLAQLCGPNNIDSSYCVCYIIDNQPPNAWLVYPPEDSHTRCGPGEGTICIGFSDTSGIDPATIFIEVDGSIPVGAPPWFWDADSGHFCGSVPSDAISDPGCGVVDIVVVMAGDLLGNIVSNRDTFTYIWDREPPHITHIYPEPGITIAADSIVIALQDDCSWLMQSATCIEITHYDYDSSAYIVDTIWADDPNIEWLVDAPTKTDTMVFWARDVGIDWDNNDSIFFCLACASDSMDIDECGFNELTETDSCWWIFMSAGGPILSLNRPPNNSYISCEWLTTVFTCYDEDGVDEASCTLSYTYNLGTPVIICPPDPSVIFFGGATSADDDTIFFSPNQHLSHSDQIYVEFTSALDEYGVQSSSSRGATYYVDQQSPVVTWHNPASGEVLAIPSPIIRAAFADYDAGIDYNSVYFTIAAGTYDTSIVYWSGDTAVLNAASAGLSFCGGETVEVCVGIDDATISIDLGDSTICPPNHRDSCWSFTFETGGPIITPTLPRHNWIVTCDPVESLSVMVSDENGIDWTTFHIEIDACGTHYDYTYSSHMHLRDSTVIIEPFPAITCEGTVFVDIDVADNICNDSTISYYFIIDHTGPEILEYYPGCDTIVDEIPHQLVLYAYDEYSYPDPNGLCVCMVLSADWSDTICVCGDTTFAIWNNDDTLVINLDTLDIHPIGGDTLCWWVDEIADYSDLCEPNGGLPGGDCCFEISSQGPRAVLMNPDAGTDGILFIGCDFPLPVEYTIRFGIYDEEGVIEDSIKLISACVGDIDTFDIGDDLYLSGSSGDTVFVEWVPLHDPCDECTTFHVTILARDIMMNRQQPNDFPMAIDRTRPDEFIIVIDPPAGGDAMDLHPDIILRCPDWCAGPNPDSFCVSFSSHYCTIESIFCGDHSRISWSDDTMTLNTDGLDIIAQDTICICVDRVVDNVDICPNSREDIDTCYWIYIAQFGPVVTLLEPEISGLVCPEDSIVIVFYDPDTLDTTTVNFSQDGTPIPIGTNPYWLVPCSVLVYQMPPVTTSPVEITLWGQTDMLGYMSDSSTFIFQYDINAPVADWLEPVGPLPDDSIPSGLPNFIFDITDDLNEIDSLSIIFVIHGDTYYVSSPILEWFRDGDSLVYSCAAAADTLFAGDSFEVCLTVSDSTGCAENNILETCWSVFVTEGEGPHPTLTVPSRDSATIACRDTFYIKWHCSDPEGLRDEGALVSMKVNAGAVTLYDDGSGHISYNADTLIFMLPDTLYFDPPRGFVDGDVIYIRILNIEDTWGNSTEDTTEYVFYIDYSGPQVVGEGPTGYVGLTSPEMWWAFNDISPVDTTSAVVTISIGGTPISTISWPDSMRWDAPETLVVYGYTFSGGDEVQVCLDSIADITDLCGPNWTSDTCFSFILPQNGPLAELLTPTDGAVTYCEDQILSVSLCDSQGIMYDSLIVVIEHASDIDTYTVDDIGTLIDTFLASSAPEDICDSIHVHPMHLYEDCETVTVRLHVFDTLWNPSLEYEWHFIVDVSPPIGVNFNPASGGTTWTWNQDITGQIYDICSRLNTDAIEVWITDNSSPWLHFIWDDPEIWYDYTDSTLNISTDSLWKEFHEYCVYVHVQDTASNILYCPANIDTVSWCFFVGDDDTTGPEIFPDSCFGPGFDPNFSVSCSIYDASGIFDTIDYADQGMFAVFDTGACPEIDSYLVIVDIIYDSASATANSVPGGINPALLVPGTCIYYMICAYDNDFDFDNPDDRKLVCSECEMCCFHDVDAPSVWPIEPDDGWYYNCLCEDQRILIGMFDWDGVDGMYGVIEANGVPHEFTDSEVNVYGNVGIPGTTYAELDIPETECWQHAETVNVRIYDIQDVYANVHDEEIFTFIMDMEPPTVYYAECGSTMLYSWQLQTIEIEIHDLLAGTDPNSIVIEFDGKRLDGSEYNLPFGVSDIGVDYYDSTQTVSINVPNLGGLDLQGEDSLWIRVADACDLTQGCDPNCIEEPYVCFKFMAKEYECRAHPNPFTPNGDASNPKAYFDYPKRFFREATIYIYDMQGVELQKIGVGDESSYCWNGTDSQGDACRPGVYVYVIEVEGEVICTGTVVLAR